MSPGGLRRFSKAHRGVKHLSPFRNSFSPDRRQRRQDGPVYLPMGLELHSPSFWRAAPVVRDGRHVPNTGNKEPGALKRPDCGLSSCAWAFDEHVYLAKALIHTLAGSLFRGTLCGEGSAFSRALESHCPGAGGGDDVTLRIRQANQRVIEGGIDIGPSLGH